MRLILLTLNLSIILEDSSSSSDEGYSRASTSRNGASNFTVSTHSAFQPNVPKPIAQRASSSQNQESVNSPRMDETVRSTLLSDNLNNESNEDNIQDNRTSNRTRNAQETRSQELGRRQG